MTAATTTIPLSAIAPAPPTARRADDALAASVQREGLLHPIGVIAAGAAGYRVLYGHRRLDAARKAGLREVSCTVFPPDLPPAEQRAVALVEQLTAAPLPPLDEGRAYRALLALGWTPQDIAARVGRKPSRVAALAKIAGLPRQVHDILATLPSWTPSAMSLLCRMPVPRIVQLLESKGYVASDSAAARDALAATGIPLADAPFDAAATCAGCRTCFDNACQNPECYGAKLDDHTRAELARARTSLPGYAAAKAVISVPSSNSAEEALYRGQHAVRLDAAHLRLANDGEEGGDPALLIDGGRVVPVRLLPAERAPDGRAARHADPAAHHAALEARERALRVADLLDARLRQGPRPLDDDALPAAVRALASALAGRDLDDAGAFHALLALVAPRLLDALRKPAIAIPAADRDALAARVRAVLGTGSVDQ